MPERRLATVEEVAELLAVSVTAARARIKAGEWPTYRIGRAVRLDPDEVLRIARVERAQVE